MRTRQRSLAGYSVPESNPPQAQIGPLGDAELTRLYETLMTTLAEMTRSGGRNTGKDLFGTAGGYRQLLARNTSTEPCCVCGGETVKESYLGGAIYYCRTCQPMK